MTNVSINTLKNINNMLPVNFVKDSQGVPHIIKSVLGYVETRTNEDLYNQVIGLLSKNVDVERIIFEWSFEYISKLRNEFEDKPQIKKAFSLIERRANGEAISKKEAYASKRAISKLSSKEFEKRNDSNYKFKLMRLEECVYSTSEEISKDYISHYANAIIYINDTDSYLTEEENKTTNVERVESLIEKLKNNLN